MGEDGTSNSTQIVQTEVLQSKSNRFIQQHNIEKRKLLKAGTEEQYTKTTVGRKRSLNRIKSDLDNEPTTTRPSAKHENADPISNGISSMFNKLTFGFFGEAPQEEDWKPPPPLTNKD